jgi:predicted transcriptional regulator
MNYEFPKHIEEILVKRRDSLIVQLDNEKYKLKEIAFIFKISTQRVYQIINNYKSKQLLIKKGK